MSHNRAARYRTIPESGGARQSTRRSRLRLPAGSDAFLLALVALAVLKMALARGLAAGSGNVFAALLLETAAIVTVLGVVDQLGTRRPYLLDLAAYAAMSCVILANVVYIAEFSRPIDPRMLLAAGEATAVWDSVLALLRPSHALFVLDIPLLAVWAVRLRGLAKSSPARRPLRAVGLGVLALAMVALAVQVTLVLRLPEDTNPIAVIGGRGFGPSGAAMVLRLVSRDEPRVPALRAQGGAEVQRGIEELRRAEKGTRIAAFARGAYRGKNVILIQVETLQSMGIGARLNGQEVTPNLNRLAEESWSFPNTFSQAGSGVTADAEFVANSGLYGPVTGYASVAYADREIPALPRLLGASGYDSVTLHTNYASFWNRDELYPALGFRRYFDHDFFADRDKMWHSSDQVLFEDGLGVLGEMKRSGRPIYAQFVTMTSHSPFRYPVRGRRPLKVSDSWYASPVGKWATAISYTDRAIGEFIDGLKKQGLYDDSIIVVYGDHSGMQVSEMIGADDAVVREMTGRSWTIADRQRMGMIVHLPGQKKGTVSTAPLGQVDIMPTVADLVGLDITSVPHAGKSAFVDSEAFIPTRGFLPVGTLVNDRVVLVPGLTFADAKAYDMLTGAPVATTETDRRDLERQRRLNEVSDSWIRSLPRRPDAPEQMDKGF